MGVHDGGAPMGGGMPLGGVLGLLTRRTAADSDGGKLAGSAHYQRFVSIVRRGLAARREVDIDDVDVDQAAEVNSWASE